MTLKKRACTGVSNGKFSEEELTLLASVLPRGFLQVAAAER